MINNIWRLSWIFRNKVFVSRNAPYPHCITGLDKTFRIRVAALRDIYNLLAQTSKDQQSLRLLPWERQASSMEAIEKLRLMATTLQAVRSDCRRVLADQDAIRRVLCEEGDSDELPERWPCLSKNASALSGERVRQYDNHVLLSACSENFSLLFCGCF